MKSYFVQVLNDLVELKLVNNNQRFISPIQQKICQQ